MLLVRVRNPEHQRQGVWMFHQPEYFEYQGDEVKLKWIGADELALTTGDPEWPVRVLQRKYIISIDGRAVSNPSSQTQTRIVKGSKGEEYVASNLGGKLSCTCQGFQFRKSCRHVKELA